MLFREYLGLQLKLKNRYLRDFGLNPLLAAISLGPVFFTLSYLLFTRTNYAIYIYTLLAIGIVLSLSETRRNDFLRYVFSKNDYFIIRITENLLTVLPFILFLCLYRQFLPAIALILISACLAIVNINKPSTITIPTPFYKKPYEFIEGFRRQYLLFIGLFILSIVSVGCQNFNLGIFALMGIFLLCLNFYGEPEEAFYVWIHQMGAKEFLWYKIKTALVFSAILTLPVSFLLLPFFPGSFLFIAGFHLLGCCYIVTSILAKYAAYPNKINLPQSLLLALALVMPPVLLILAPFFYIQSVKRLNEILA